MKRLILFGDSHGETYRAAAMRMGRANVEIGGGRCLSAKALHDEFFLESDDGIAFINDATESFRRYREAHGIPNLPDCPPRSLVVSMGLAAAPFYGHADWRSRCSFAPESRSFRMIVSETVIRQIVRDLQQFVLNFYDWLDRKELIFAAVASPRPQRRHPVVRELGAEKVLRLTELYEEPIRQRLAELRCPVIDLPETTDDSGLLREEYWGHNWSHANIAFGTLVIEQLDCRLLQATGRSEEDVPDPVGMAPGPLRLLPENRGRTEPGRSQRTRPA